MTPKRGTNLQLRSLAGKYAWDSVHSCAPWSGFYRSYFWWSIYACSRCRSALWPAFRDWPGLRSMIATSFVYFAFFRAPTFDCRSSNFMWIIKSKERLAPFVDLLIAPKPVRRIGIAIYQKVGLPRCYVRYHIAILPMVLIADSRQHVRFLEKTMDELSDG